MKNNSSYLLIALAILVIAMIAFTGCTDTAKVTPIPSSGAPIPATTTAQLKTLNVGYSRTTGTLSSSLQKRKDTLRNRG